MNNYKSNLIIRYTWVGNISDARLTTRISFLSSTEEVLQDFDGEVSYGSSIYVNVVANEDLLEITIDLEQAYLDGEITETLSIECFAELDFGPYGDSAIDNINLQWEYDGEVYDRNLPLENEDENLVKTIRISSLGFVSNLYSDNIIYEFDPIFNLDTGDLSKTARGHSTHKNKDVSFVLNLTDRRLNVLNSPSALLENPFLKGIDVDILNIFGDTVFDNYLSGSFENSFTFTEEDNISVFGTYTPNFGIGVSAVGENIEVHNSKYFVYGNPLEIDNIYVTDASGLWLNNNPIQYQSYVPYETFKESIDGQLVTNNALYISGYRDRVSGYNIEISGSVPFAILSGESLKIDWGIGQIDTIFIQTGIDGFSGIDGVNVTNTFTGDPILSLLVNPTGLNGKAYSFVTGYSYEATGIYDVNLYYSGIGSSGDELVKTLKYRIPDELQSQGKLQIGDADSEKIQFDIRLQNNPFYTSSNEFAVYSSTGSGDFSVLNTSIPILSKSQRYSFYLNENNIVPDVPHWFKIEPYSPIGSGYAWEVGPYFFSSAPSVKTNVSSDSFSLTNGDSQADIDFITGSVETDSITTIDILPKGEKYSYEYFAQFKDGLGHHCSSKIIIVDNTSGQDNSRTGLAFEEYSRSENSFVIYSVSGDEDNIYLNAQLDDFVGFYKLYKTSI
jgi:hypothetical protein